VTTRTPAENGRNGMSAGRTGAIWFSVLGPPFAVFTQQQVSYALVAAACHQHAGVPVQLPALAAFAVIGAAVLFSRQQWRRGDPSGRFFGALGFLMGGISAVVTLAQWLPTFFLDPCQR
jgi:hypothetical protein